METVHVAPFMAIPTLTPDPRAKMEFLGSVEAYVSLNLAASISSGSMYSILREPQSHEFPSGNPLSSHYNLLIHWVTFIINNIV